MPIYNFVCDECGSHYDHWMSFQDHDKATTCPNGHTRTRRILSMPTVVFKGSGFYVTDHRSKSTSNEDR